LASENNSPRYKLIPLLFLSGFCALVYQVAWLRELRLVFGVSTMAISAVLAIFMGGIGIGSYFLGSYAEKHKEPLKLYGYLELGIAVAAFASPFLISVVRLLYIAMGGSQAMGLPLATFVRLVMSAMILGVPTFLMGGTLPAVARAVETDADVDRSDVGLMYGVNTLGAVSGVLFAYFFMLEHLGTLTTTWLASLLNGMVGLGALNLARYTTYSRKPGSGTKAVKDELAAADTASFTYNHNLILAAGAVVGFVFMLMEIVWYRMLSPLLGGTTYTFGLVLAVALLGIGIGGWLYSLRRLNAPVTLVGFAMTCGLEAFCLALPFALGDRIAIWSVQLIPSDAIVGFYNYVVAWLQTTVIVVLPAAIVAGYQFPLLVALMGRGRQNVARHTGYIYASNTTGSIIGSLAGGFGLLPLLTATGCWQLAIWLLLLLALVAMFYSIRVESFSRIYHVLSPVIIIGTIVLLHSHQGPTAAWRHGYSSISKDQAGLMGNSPNEVRAWLNEERSYLVWEAEGIESMVGLRNYYGLAFFINGKVDGNAKYDAPTQVMGPLVGAILHPDPQKALVIGMGTGSSAGWLAEVPTMRRVDQIELEKVMFEVARRSAPVNNNVLEHPKVNNIIGDGREFLLTSSNQYDLIFSEPSNPYRAGIASLYSREFYQAVEKRLKKGGIFSQWVQGYAVDTRIVRIIYATLYSVFPSIEVWETMQNDLLFVCSMEEIPQTIPGLRKRIDQEPFRSALLYTWGSIDLEGFLSHYVANVRLAKSMAAKDLEEGLVNTDDRMLLEFSFARTMMNRQLRIAEIIRQEAWKRKMNTPLWMDAGLDWQKILENYDLLAVNQGFTTQNSPDLPKDRQVRIEAYNLFNADQLAADQILQLWKQQHHEVKYPLEIAMLAEAYAEKGHYKALPLINQLKKYFPVTAEAILAKYYLRSKDPEQALNSMREVFTNLRTHPWVMVPVMYRALIQATEMARTFPVMAPVLFELVSEPFCVSILERYRKAAMLEISNDLPIEKAVEALQEFEPHVPWNEGFLRARFEVYKETNHSMIQQAEKDLNDFLKNKNVGLINKANGQ